MSGGRSGGRAAHARRGVLVLLALASWACMNHYAVHPRTAPPSVLTWTEDVPRGPLRLHLEWAAPAASPPFPAVVVHPEAGADARAMRGVVWDLASRGYLAVAADYRRLIDGKYRRTLFPWRVESEPTLVISRLLDEPRVDGGRVGLLGFSQGGVFSLCIAAQDPRVKAVVAYYPVTDFEAWLNDPRRGPLHRAAFRFIRGHFRRQSGARTDEEFARMLERASPLRWPERIAAPVLLVHGIDDRTASVDESRRLAARLKALGRTVELLEVQGAGHVFNFYDREAPRARVAWESTLAFFDRHLK